MCFFLSHVLFFIPRVIVFSSLFSTVIDSVGQLVFNHWLLSLLELSENNSLCHYFNVTRENCSLLSVFLFRDEKIYSPRLKFFSREKIIFTYGSIRLGTTL